MSAFWRRIGPLAALAIALSIPVAGQGRSALALGVLRRDGVLIPFASFNGRSWSAEWPGVDSTDLPISVESVPKRWWGGPGPSAAWTAFFQEGKTRPLALKSLAHLRVFCNTHLGIQTDYEGGPFDPRDPTLPKDALAIAGAAQLLPIVPISLHAQDAKKIADAITEAFNKEEQTAATHFLNWVHPYAPEVRKRLPIELETFYRASESTPSGRWVTNYIEAVRRFPAGPFDNGCGLITFVRGWVLQREGREPVIDLGARITYCDREGVSFMQPFGRLLISREPYWVYQVSSWRDEIYAVSRITPGEVRPVLAVAGGGCPKDAGPPRRGRQ